MVYPPLGPTLRPEEPLDGPPPTASSAPSAADFRAALRELSKPPAARDFNASTSTCASCTSDLAASYGASDFASSSEAPEELDDASRPASCSRMGEAPAGPARGFEALDYGNPLYWKQVYRHWDASEFREEVTKEWLLSYEYFKLQRWHRYLRGGSILEIGCGNSDFASEAYDDGFHDITCTDIDQGVVETMRAWNRERRPKMKYCTCDATDMSAFRDGSFDIIFDKSTMDALGCAGRAKTSRCSREVHRVLSDSGVYLCVSFGEPSDMTKVIQDTGDVGRRWKIEAHMGLEESDVFFYVCRKEPTRK